MQDLVAGGLHVGPDDVGYTVVESVTVDASQTKATVIACWWDTAVLYGPPAQPGGPEIVMNNKQSTSRAEATLFLEAGTWRIGQERSLERIEA